MVAIVLVIVDLIVFIYKISCKRNKIDNQDSNIKYERDIFEIIEQDFKAVRIVVNLLLLFTSIYIFIFVDSLLESVKEFRNRLYAIAKL